MENERIRKREYRNKRKEAIQADPKLHDAEKEKSRLRQRKFRQKQKDKLKGQVTEDTQPYTNLSELERDFQKAKRNLPSSPEKRKLIVQMLANEYDVVEMEHECDDNIDQKKCSSCFAKDTEKYARQWFSEN